MKVTHKPAVVFFRLQFLLAVTHSQQVSLVDVKCHDLLKQLIQSLHTSSSSLNSYSFAVIITPLAMQHRPFATDSQLQSPSLVHWHISNGRSKLNCKIVCLTVTDSWPHALMILPSEWPLRSVSTTRVHGPSWRVSKNAPEFSGRQLDPWTRPVNSGSGNRPLDGYVPRTQSKVMNCEFEDDALPCR